MSYYGKKALIEWNYTSECQTKYEKSNKNIKNKILKYWYPIGMNVIIPLKYKITHLEEHIVYTIISHNDNGTILLESDKKTKIINPISAIPTESSIRSLKREIKIRQLGL